MRGRNVLFATGVATVLVVAGAAAVLACKGNGMSCGASASTSATVAPMQASFAVTNLTCKGCEKKIGKAVKKLDGVENYSVDLTKQAVYVAFVPGKTTAEAIGTTLAQAGYPATLVGITAYNGEFCTPGMACPHPERCGMGKGAPGGCPYSGKGGKAKASTSAKSSM